MRFQGFIYDIVNRITQEKHDKLSNLAENINGGWEVWMQVELFFSLQKGPLGLSEFEREPTYPNSGGKRADFLFRSSNAPGVSTWVELKTQKKSNERDAADRFFQDCRKINDINLGYDNTLGAVVIIPRKVNEALDYARVNAPADFREKICFYLVDSNEVSSLYSLSNPLVKAKSDQIVVMYYPKL